MSDTGLISFVRALHSSDRLQYDCMRACSSCYLSLGTALELSQASICCVKTHDCLSLSRCSELADLRQFDHTCFLYLSTFVARPIDFTLLNSFAAN